jgi:hypothetical protein
MLVFNLVAPQIHYVGTTFIMKMNSNDITLCDNISNKQNIDVLKRP